MQDDSKSTTLQEIEILHGRLKEATRELDKRKYQLDVLQEISKAISYSISYEQLTESIMDSLHKVLDYDVCASLLLYGGRADVRIKTARPVDSEFIQELKLNMVEAVNSTSDWIFGEEDLLLNLEGSQVYEPEEKKVSGQINSFCNVPLFIGKEIVGLLNISSSKKKAFTEGDLNFLYSIANQTSTAIGKIRALIDSERNKMEVMIRSLVGGAIMIDEQGKIVTLNPAAKKMLGFHETDKAIVSNNAFKNIQDCDLPELLNEVFTTSKAITKKLVSGGPLPKVLKAVFVPVKGVEGKIIGIVLTLEDITEFVKLDREKSELIATVSHEIRTPLTSISGHLDVLVRKIKENDSKESQMKNIRIIEKSSNRLNTLISNLLDLSALEELGRLELIKEPLDLVKIAREIVHSLSLEAAEKMIKLRIEGGKGLPLIDADKEKIERVFMNLISNAIKYTPEKKSVRILVKNERERIRVSIIDSGIGIPASEQDKIFGKFWRVGDALIRKVKGAGLGLPISRRIIQEHDGRIWVESTLNKGSKFIFVLPKGNA